MGKLCGETVCDHRQALLADCLHQEKQEPEGLSVNR